jgi:ElaB/YqjD/DUF883 family membrane-anchored ribosome-binding protein
MENHTASARTHQTLVKDIGKLKDNALQFKENALQVAQDVKNHAAAHVGDTRQRLTDTVVTTREYMVSHPLSLLGAGFVVGLLFGLRLRR